MGCEEGKGGRDEGKGFWKARGGGEEKTEKKGKETWRRKQKGEGFVLFR